MHKTWRTGELPFNHQHNTKTFSKDKLVCGLINQDHSYVVCGGGYWAWGAGFLGAGHILLLDKVTRYTGLYTW